MQREPGELSDSEILRRYGDTIWKGLEAFRADPTYVVAMVEAGAKLRDRRRLRSPDPSPVLPASERAPKTEPGYRQEAVRLRREGSTVAEIAARLDVSTASVSRACRAAGLTRPHARSADDTPA